MTLGTGLVGSGILQVYQRTVIASGSAVPDFIVWLGTGLTYSVPNALLLFVPLAALIIFALRRTGFGRQVYAIGKNASAARYSGVRVTRVKVSLFVLSGLISALAGIILTARLNTARADAATGLTLTVVTIVLLGGVNIFGGSGTIPGVVLAVLVIAVMQNALRLASVTVQVQAIALGLLLILSVVIPTSAHQAKSAFDRARGGRPPPVGSVAQGERSGPTKEEEQG